MSGITEKVSKTKHDSRMIFDSFLLKSRQPQKIAIWNGEDGKFLDVTFREGCSFIYPYKAPAIPAFDNDISAEDQKRFLALAESFRERSDNIITGNIHFMSLERVEGRPIQIQVISDFKSKDRKDLRLITNFPLQPQPLILILRQADLLIRVEVHKSSFKLAVNNGARMEFLYGDTACKSHVTAEGIHGVLKSSVKAFDSIGGELLSDAANLLSDNSDRIIKQYSAMLEAALSVTANNAEKSR